MPAVIRRYSTRDVRKRGWSILRTLQSMPNLKMASFGSGHVLSAYGLLPACQLIRIVKERGGTILHHYHRSGIGDRPAIFIERGWDGRVRSRISLLHPPSKPSESEKWYEREDGR